MSVKYRILALLTLIKNYRKLERHKKDKKRIRKMYKEMAKKILSGKFYYY